MNLISARSISQDSTFKFKVQRRERRKHWPNCGMTKIFLVNIVFYRWIFNRLFVNVNMFLASNFQLGVRKFYILLLTSRAYTVQCWNTDFSDEFLPNWDAVYFGIHSFSVHTYYTKVLEVLKAITEQLASLGGHYWPNLSVMSLSAEGHNCFVKVVFLDK